MAETSEGQPPSEAAASPRRKEDPVQIVAVIAKSMILVVKLLFVLMRLKRKAKKAGKTFRKAAIKGGMDRALATQLSEEYADFASIRKLMKSAMGSKSFLS
jgi:hypothetical protein